MLFSTNVMNAIDGKSFCVEFDGDSTEVTRKLHDACKYSAITIVPVGEPMNGAALELDVAIEEIKKIVLHKITEVHVSSNTYEVELPDNVSVRPSDNNTDSVIVAINTDFNSCDPNLVRKEHDIVSKLLMLFKNITYNKCRNSFLVSSERTPATADNDGNRISYGCINGHLVAYKDVYTASIDEIKSR